MDHIKKLECKVLCLSKKHQLRLHHHQHEWEQHSQDVQGEAGPDQWRRPRTARRPRDRRTCRSPRVRTQFSQIGKICLFITNQKLTIIQ